MKMEVLPSTDRKNLEWLLDTFGSVLSLEDIASAYCQSGYDLYAAREILSNLQRSTPKASSPTSEEELESVNTFSECQSEKSMETTEFTKSKPRKCPASTGTVSGVIGRDYVRSRPATNESWKPKPLKPSSNDIPVAAIWGEKDFPATTARSETMHLELEEFLFKMLGDGFSLEMSVIQEIVGQCGYDMKKSVEKLLDLSASTLEKSDDILKGAPEKYHNLESKQFDGPFPCIHSSGSSQCTLTAEKALQLPNRKDEKYALQKAVLGALFTVPERSEELVKSHPRKEVRRSRAHGKPVEEPLKEMMIEHRSVITRRQVITENDDGENEGTYEVLRKAVKEYWMTMKEYYKAAVDALSKQDHERAYKLLEEGHFYMKKAREADEKSAQKILERNDEEEMVVDVHEFDPKEAVRFLKVQLTTLSGIPSFKYLKLLVGSNEENTKHVSRRRLVIKLLERETIRWSEEGNGWIIIIPLDEINPKKLSFAKKESAMH